MDDILRWEKRNTVDAAKQLSGPCFFGDFQATGPRVLFVGNSITLHGKKADIGWMNDWGMAASAREKDYVHLFMQLVQSAHPQASFALAQAADWERAYLDPTEALSSIDGAQRWNADLIVLRLGENMPSEGLTETNAAEAIVRLMDWLDPHGKARFLVTDTFFPNPVKCAALYRAALARNACFVSLMDLGQRDDMKAIGLFAHEGVANHPGDKGMEAIAERLFAAAKDMLSDA